MGKPAESANPKSPRKCFRIDWWLVAVILLPALYFLPELLGYTVFAGIDTSRLNMPLRFFDRQAFADGSLPLWNPYMFAGFPNLAESESGVFYPGNIFIHLPGDFFHWYSIEAIVHFMIAAAGFYTWMRIRGHSSIASAFLAATYSTTPFLIFHITAFGLFTSIVWLPWYLVIFDLGLKGRHPVRVGLWLALFLGFMLLSGSPQAAFLGAFALVLYGLGKLMAQPDRESRKRMFLRIVAVLLPAVIAPILAAVQILPTAELTRFSERAATHTIEFYRLGTWLTIPRLISTVVFPALDNPSDIQDYGSSLCFMGAVPFILAIVSLGMWKKTGRAIFPLLLVGLVTLILGFGLNLPGYSVLAEIPPFSLFRYPGRMAHVALTFFLALAAPAIDSALERITGGKTDSRHSWWRAYLVGAGIVTLAGIVGLFMSGVVRMGAVPTLFFGILAILFATPLYPGGDDHRKRNLIGGTIAALVVFSLLAQIFLTYPFSRALVQERKKFDQSLEFFDGIKSEFPTDLEIPRVLMPGSHYLMDPDALSKLGFKAQEDIWDNMSGNASGLREVTALQGLTPLNQNDWKLVLRDTLQSRMDAVLQRAKETGSEKVPDDLSMKIIRMFGADVLLLEGGDWRVPGYELWREDLALPYHKGLCAYRADNGWVPDAYFATRARFDSTGYTGFLKWSGDQGTAIGEDALIEIPNGGERSQEFLAESCRIEKRERGFNWMRFEVTVESDRAGARGFLITGENYYPGWRAYVDEVRTDYYRTNLLFGGLYVEPGRHTVELRYAPRSVLIGVVVSLSGLLVWAVLMATVMWVHRFGRTTIVAPDEGNESVELEN